MAAPQKREATCIARHRLQTCVEAAAESEEAYNRLLALEQASHGRVMSRPVSACARVLAPILLQACRSGAANGAAPAALPADGCCGGGGSEGPAAEQQGQPAEASSEALQACKQQLVRSGGGGGH